MVLIAEPFSEILLLLLYPYNFFIVVNVLLSRSPFHVHVLIVLIKRLFSLLLITEFNTKSMVYCGQNNHKLIICILVELRLSIDPSFPTMNIFKFFVSSSKVYF